MLFQSLPPPHNTHFAIHGAADVSKFLSFQVTGTNGSGFKLVSSVNINRWLWQSMASGLGQGWGKSVLVKRLGKGHSGGKGSPGGKKSLDKGLAYIKGQKPRRSVL